MSIGENIKKVRKEQGLTQKQLGDKLEISQQAVAMYEKDTENKIKITTVKKIAAALNVPLERLITQDYIHSEFERVNNELRTRIMNFQVDYFGSALVLSGYAIDDINNDIVTIRKRKDNNESHKNKVYQISLDDVEALNNMTVQYFKYCLEKMINKENKK